MGSEFSRQELNNGEWDDDLNKFPDNEYFFVSHEYKCKIKRNRLTWTYCGYVYLPPDHIDYNKSYNELEDIIKVHGNLTYGNNGVFGFDCCHSLMGDVSPVSETLKIKDPKLFQHVDSLSNRYHYWTFEDVKKETENMAKQFKDREN